MKKSRQSLSKLIARKDLINSISVLSALLIVAYGILMFLLTVSPETNEFGKTISSIEQELSIYSTARYDFCYETESVFLLTVIAGLVLGISQFAFLHRKKYSSTLFSFSISRKSLYFNRLILPLALMVLCIIIPHLVTLKINIDILGFKATMLPWFILHILTIIQILVTTYSISVFSCMLTGRTIEAVAGSISITILPTTIFYVTENVFRHLLYGYSGDVILPNIDPTYLCSIMFFQKLFGHYPIDYPLGNENIIHLTFSVLWILLSAGFMYAFSLYFSKKFKPENTGFKGINKGMVFIISFTIPLYLCAFSIDILDSYLYPNISLQSNLVIVLASALIGFVASVVCGIIIHFTHKKLKVSLISGASLICASAVLITLSLTGILGTYNKIPEASEIEKIEIESPFTECFPDFNYYTDFARQTNYNSSTALIATEKEDIEIVCDIHKKVAKKGNEPAASNFNVVYTLKNGSKITRKYSFLSEEATKEVTKLWDTQAAKDMYKRCLFPSKKGAEVLDTDPVYSLAYHEQPHIGDYNEEHTFLNITTKDGTKHSVLNKISEKEYIELKKAIYKDICEMNSAEWYTPEKSQIGQISFSIANYQQFSERSLCINFYVNENMTNTINALKELDLYKYLKNTKEICGVLVADIKDYASWQNGRFFDKKSKTVHQPYFVYDNNEYYWTVYEAPVPYGDYGKPPFKEVTDKLQIKSLTENGYMAYNILNNGKFVFVKYADDTYSSYVIPYEK